MGGALPILMALALSTPQEPARNATLSLATGAYEPLPRIAALSLAMQSGERPSSRLRLPTLLEVPLVVRRGAPGDEKLEDVCFGDYCPPRVSIDGYGPTFDADARKLELALQVLRGVGWAPLTRVAEVCAATGFALDIRPGQVEALSGRASHGWGEARVFFRWRLGPDGLPTWASR